MQKDNFNSILVRFKPIALVPVAYLLEFQFYISAIQTVSTLSVPSPHTNFNSILVRFKLALVLRLKSLKRYFNSILVRFKQVNAVMELPAFRFQFYISAIQTRIPRNLRGMYAHFNSILVRFKQRISTSGHIEKGRFQFYISAIQTGFLRTAVTDPVRFQFYISAIQTLLYKHRVMFIIN